MGPLPDPFDLILHFPLMPLVVCMHAKVSSFDDSQDMEGSKNFKVGHVTHFGPNFAFFR